MNRTLRYVVLPLPLLAIAAGAALGVTIPNWAVPHSSAFGTAAFSISDLSGPLPFVPVTPCRLADTRAASGFPAGYGPPSLAGAHAQRTFTIINRCGIPASAKAVSFNFTVWAPVTRGDLRVFPAGGGTPNVATLNWEAGIQALANAAIVPLSTGGAITLQVDGPGTVDMIIDVNGYFSDTPANQANPFSIINNSTSWALYARNDNSLCTGACGVYGLTAGGDAISGTAIHGTGVVGYSTGGGDGVFGRSKDGSGAGVHGLVTPPASGSTAVWGENQLPGMFGAGVHGSHAGTGWGVFGEVLGTSGFGAIGVMGLVQSSSNGAYGVCGKSLASTGSSNGVYGFGGSQAHLSAGVLGSDFVGASDLFSFGNITSGVRGIGRLGVLGTTSTSGGAGVEGIRTDSYGLTVTGAALGLDTYGVWAVGNIGASGTKSFVAPHPTDPTLVINYVALEGPEAGTYFRGRGRFVGKSATIAVPESFRLVTDAEGLSIQVTPVGDFAQVAVLSIDLDAVVLKSTRDVEFFYTVNGVRSAYRDHQPIAATAEYSPRSEHDRMPLGLSVEAKQHLIANGTYNPDGTVNMETARRVGWVKVWEERKAEAEAAGAARREAEARIDQQNRPRQ
jgi:hypothetical protein